MRHTGAGSFASNSIDANFCVGGGSFTSVDYDNTEDMTCQQASPASITLLPRS